MPTVGIICASLDRFAPPERAAEWDNVGLLLGDPNTEVQRVLTCLTVTPEVVAEAIETGVQLIVTHHPILFRGAKRLSTTSSDGKLLWPLARVGVAVYSPHTAFDNTAGGVNDILARRLGLVDIKPLRPASIEKRKIVVFVPDNDLAKVSDAMFAAGAGIIGQYSQCSFRLPGIGTFFGADSTNPTVGHKGQREEVSEWRLEVVCPDSSLSDVLLAMRKAHSYEEPAYDVYPLKSVGGGQGGEGRIGGWKNALSPSEVAKQVKTLLSAGAVQVVGDEGASIRRLAIACGAAGEFLSDAQRARADAFLTGEMRFHDYLRAKEMGIALILPGHYATERPAVEELAAMLQREWPGLAIGASKRERDPATWV
jgi:dinuclear metal center YbgI/SA1388 family protein